MSKLCNKPRSNYVTDGELTNVYSIIPPQARGDEKIGLLLNTLSLSLKK